MRDPEEVVAQFIRYIGDANISQEILAVTDDMVAKDENRDGSGIVLR